MLELLLSLNSLPALLLKLRRDVICRLVNKTADRAFTSLADCHISSLSLSSESLKLLVFGRKTVLCICASSQVILEVI